MSNSHLNSNPTLLSQFISFLFHASYLYGNELIGYVVFTDFDETWPEYSSAINSQRE